MQESLQKRLEELKNEYNLGEKQLQALEMQQAQLRDTMLQISGAIQVIEELLEAQGKTQPSAD